jgi:LPS O-antigen subunit length determinant protein (WzzB/FepE family)
MTTAANQKPKVNEIDLTTIVAILWRQRKLIVIGTLAVTLLAAALSFAIPKTYRSEGFYQLGNPEKKISDEMNAVKENLVGIPIPLYKKSAPQFFNPTRLYAFARQEGYFSEKELGRIRTIFRSEKAITRWITPVFAYSKGDLRDLAQVPKEESNSVLGLNLSFESGSPEKAYKFVRFFGKYVRDCLLYVSLYNYVKDEYSKIISELSRNGNHIIDLQFNLQQNIRKMLDIKAILKKYPESAKIDSRQLVSVQEGGFRFLPPITQLVGLESALADQRQGLAELEREREMLVIRREYFSKCNEALNKLGRRGEMIFSQLKSIKSDVFKNKDFRKGTVKAVVNDLSIDLQVFDLAFFTNCRFISDPTIPVRPIKPRKSVIVCMAFFISLFFFMALALILHWWQGNKKAIQAFKE